jgi:NTE family protein
VLGSGGVRSIAAVGIAEVLWREGIRPQLVVGCSSGALFGALVASATEPREALEMARRLWSQELTMQRRWRAYAQLVAPRLAGFNADFALRDSTLIAQRIEQAFGDVRIEELPIPLRVTATDAVTGRPVVIERGPLAPALRASMALPFLFPPVRIDGRRLVDGVVSDPLPVSAAARAQAVITLGFEGAMPRRIDRPSRLVAQHSTSLMNNLMRARLEAAEARGQRLLHLALKLKRRIGLWETDALPELFEAGQRAAEDRLDKIHALLDSAPHCAAA